MHRHAREGWLSGDGARQWAMVQGGDTYIMTDKICGVLHMGVTANLVARIEQHRHGMQATSPLEKHPTRARPRCPTGRATDRPILFFAIVNHDPLPPYARPRPRAHMV